LVDKVKVAVVGTGRVFQHYKALYIKGLLPGIEIVGLFDLDPVALDSDFSIVKVKHFRSLEELLKADFVEAVFILTPSGTHFQIAKEVIKAKKATLIEKPMCLNVADAKELQDLAIQNGVYLQSILQNRFNPAVLKLKELLASGQVTQPISGGLRLRWSRKSNYYQDAWHGTWKLDGGVISQQAIHHIFALDNLFGPLQSVNVQSFKRKHSLEAEDTAVGFVKSVSGVPFTLELTTAASEVDFEASISLVCSQGVVSIGGIALNELLVFKSSVVGKGQETGS
jgi:predicted dehydrogenase